MQQLAQTGVRILAGQCVSEAVAADGKQGITAAVVCALTPDGKPDSTRSQRIDCDGIAMSVGWMPQDSLINQSGGKMQYNDTVEQFVPRTLAAGVFAAGRNSGVYDLDAQLADGARAGESTAAYVAPGNASSIANRQSPIDNSPHSHPYPIFEHSHGKNFVDYDEDLKLRDFPDAVQEGFDSIELIKRYATVGMGPSQGKLANMNAVRVLAKVRGKTINETGTTTSRPFFHPVPVSHLAGRGFHPHRHTAIHHRHEKAGAVFMAAGAWLRPAYYNGSSNRSRLELIYDEVNNVRESVGMIDVGTLGKIDVCGSDAAEFIERLYTMRYANMKVGMTRYLVMCDESGVVVDDGVAARMADDRFYVTATTTGADGVYREMQRQALVWKMNVTLINNTGIFGAMNLAGPHSRKILASLTDIDVSQEAFPYLGYREGLVAGVKARLMRVGFVGELGYEIHLPANSAGHVWDAIMKAGESHGIRLFGVEAQRILRLEKGHIIIGQDTDGLTNPFEAGMEWAVKADKPFFIGQRSLKIVKTKPLTRSLVGFALPQEYHGSVPKECHLVIRDGTIVGRVTSVTFSPTLKRVIGMAYVSPDQTQLGNQFTIRIDGGQEIHAEVIRTPFYDPDNKRQTQPMQAKSEAA
jgi:sarcosine oxidase subunit alpha